MDILQTPSTVVKQITSEFHDTYNRPEKQEVLGQKISKTKKTKQIKQKKSKVKVEIEDTVSGKT